MRTKRKPRKKALRAKRTRDSAWLDAFADDRLMHHEEPPKRKVPPHISEDLELGTGGPFPLGGKPRMRRRLI